MSEITCNQAALNAELRQLKMQVQRRLKRDLALADAYFNKKFIPPTISYDVRGLKAGVAYLRRNEVRFNSVLLQENGLLFIQQVVPHEFAHLLVYQHFGNVRPHGKEWKMMMQEVLGVPAEIYHGFDTRNVAGALFPYRCACQIHLLSLRRHNTVKSGARHYICKQCRQPLQLKDN